MQLYLKELGDGMNKKGFTLIELLAVLTILIVIFLLVFPSVKNIISTNEETVYQTQINTILNATYDWSLENLSVLPDDGNKIYITLGQLKNYGYIESDIKDPNTDEQFSKDFVISIENVGSNYKNSDVYAKKDGNYLYKAEVILMNSSDYESKRPTITLSGIDEPNSSGNYVTSIDQNNAVIEPTVEAISNAGDNISSKVIVNIMYQDNIVDSVDTSKPGIYYVNYTVIDNLGYANTVVRSVIVTDKEPPVITIPETTIFGTELSSYDLMTGVTCTDNSGKCDVIVENSEVVKFGVAGKYIVNYVATDSMGNTAKIERMITIE